MNDAPINPPAPDPTKAEQASQPGSPVHKRRPRYSGKNPRRFDQKYKEQAPEKYPETIAKVIASGKTPAGSHRPILLDEILAVLHPQPGETVADCTLGFGGHARELLARIQPGGRLIGLDADPLELPRTEARLHALGFGPDTLAVHRSNFAGLQKVLATEGRTEGVEMILADLGVSSMQLDNPARGFSVKTQGPLDMRMNPQRGQPASVLLEKISVEELAAHLEENADETHAAPLAQALAGKSFTTTLALGAAIRKVLIKRPEEQVTLSIRRVFQALRIAVNEEFAALETFLRNLPACLKPGGRVAVLTFHSGEDRRVKKAFEAGLRNGLYTEIAREIIRPSPEECHSNPRSTPSKLRWAVKA